MYILKTSFLRLCTTSLIALLMSLGAHAMNQGQSQACSQAQKLVQQACSQGAVQSAPCQNAQKVEEVICHAQAIQDSSSSSSSSSSSD